MCTRYALDITQEELKEIMDVAEKHPLTTKFIDTHARPLITDGEVRPTDIVPVIAPNSKGGKSVFPMQWGLWHETISEPYLTPELRPLARSLPSRMPGTLTDVSFQQPITMSGST